MSQFTSMTLAEVEGWLMVMQEDAPEMADMLRVVISLPIWRPLASKIRCWTALLYVDDEQNIPVERALEHLQASCCNFRLDLEAMLEECAKPSEKELLRDLFVTAYVRPSPVLHAG